MARQLSEQGVPQSFYRWAASFGVLAWLSAVTLLQPCAQFIVLGSEKDQSPWGEANRCRVSWTKTAIAQIARVSS
ncbi:MAG: hypothetical protein ACFB12_02185 [Leptolyngbyaceae cyanobacterium]